jgi:hypothetical protein
LLGKPVVSGIGNTMLVPVPLQVIRKISPVGIWYAGFDRWQHSFAEDVGDLFEQYVGRLLRTIPETQVHKEIVYDRGQQRSVDWIVIWDNAVLLVEVKAARSTDPIRMGTPEGWTELATKLGTASRQLARTAERIAEGHVRFAHIPSNLPRVGLIVTMESFSFVDAGLMRSRAGLVPSVPMRVCSVDLLEWLVCLPDRSVGEYLVELMNDPSKEGWDVLGTDYAGIEFAPNAVLDQAWSSFRWSPAP